ncbi:MAG: hypothetical protein GY913_19150 [Proteobacteria bacterium]|nr:hypothetical protein [Pseudomonadota bacterium]MCP4919027.1 hypothetical protein [Pseudomonadota bacterium]
MPAPASLVLLSALGLVLWASGCSGSGAIVSADPEDSGDGGSELTPEGASAGD